MSEPVNFSQGIRNRNKEAFIARLHDEAPLYKDERGFWVVSRFEDVREVLLDHRRFSSSAMGQTMFPLLGDDPPRHSSLRALVSKAFSPARVEAMRPMVEALAHELVAKIEPGREVDIVAALTTPLPVTVIARMMGIPEADNERFKRWSDAIVGFNDNPLDSTRRETLADLRNYFRQTLVDRRRAPGSDLISGLAQAHEAGTELSDAEVVGFSILLLIAGNETTTNLLGNLLDRLAQEPGAFARLKGDATLQEAAIEEALRADSPAQFVTRLVREDTALGDQALRQGEMVIVYLAAANRDPAKWNDPANFDVARERERHIAFGYGVHTCIGAPLARLEARAAVLALSTRFSDVARGDERARRLPSGVLFGFRALPLIFRE